MMNLIRDILLNKTLHATALYGLSIVFMKGLSLIMLPFLTYNLSTSQYGELEVLTTLATIGSVLAGFGLAETLFRYCGMTQSSEEEQFHASRLITLSLSVTIFLVVISYFIAPSVSYIVPGDVAVGDVYIVLLIISFEALIAVSLGWLRMQNKVKHFCLLVCSRALVQILLTYLFVVAGYGVTGMLFASLIASAGQAFILMVLLKTHLNIKTYQQSIMPYFIYGLPVMLSSGIAFFILGVDKWFLAAYTNLAQVAVYAVAIKISLAVVILLQPFTMWWSPKRFQILNGSGASSLLFYIYLGLLILSNICIVLAGASPWLVENLVPTEYQGAITVVAPLILTMMFKEAAELINIGCFVGKNCQSQLQINLFCAVFIGILLFAFVPQYGIYAVAWCLSIGQLLRMLLFFMVSQYYLRLDYKKLYLSVLLMLLVVFVLVLPQQTQAVDSFMYIMLFLLINNVLFCVLLFNKQVKKWLHQFALFKKSVV